ncbi:hypothetical protein HDV05_008096 [Chytridiales sp. JEL 0842]|nr:hypothetical protein HDV05_008096 [Chytridiales sp. JEL 0842]
MAMNKRIAILAAIPLGFYALYKAVVPAPGAKLGNLADVKPKRGEARLDYHHDHFPNPQDADLPDGKTRYYLLGPPNGPKLLLIHGITVPWAGTSNFIHALTSRGFRVCVYDLYGRGYSDSPATHYTTDLYVRQAEGLLKVIGWEKCNVLGYSMGGGIATAFAAKWGNEKVERLILFAPAGLLKELPFMGKVVTTPFIGDLIGYGLGRHIITRASESNHDPEKKDLPHMVHCRNVTKLIIKRHPGFIRAYLSTVAHGPIRNLHPQYSTLKQKLGPKVLCVWGTEDKVVNFKNLAPDFVKLAGGEGGGHLVEVEGVGHSIVPEYHELCVEAVHGFVEGKVMSQDTVKRTDRVLVDGVPIGGDDGVDGEDEDDGEELEMSLSEVDTNTAGGGGIIGDEAVDINDEEEEELNVGKTELLSKTEGGGGGMPVCACAGGLNDEEETPGDVCRINESNRSIFCVASNSS